MKPPPFLLGAALLFWGWQTGFLIVGGLMAVALESPRVIRARWEFSNDDFSRIWTFCTLLLLAAAIYGFTANEGPSNFRGFFDQPNLHTERGAGASTARTMASLIRWLPMIFFLFLATQAFSSRQGVPLETISLILRRRWKRALRLGQPPPPSRVMNISYPYFGLCLTAASAHTGEDLTFYWGICVLLAWALWSQRPWRYSPALWAVALAVAIVLGYFGQGGLGRLQRYLETLNPPWLVNFSRRGFDASQSKTALGQIGRVKGSPKIVIRLEPKSNSSAPALLREASYRVYKGQVWYAGNSRNDFENIIEETNRGVWVLLRGKTNSAAVNLACYLPGGYGSLPLPGGSGRLEKLAAYVLKKNSAGAVMAEGPGLVMFDALYGPGPMIDSPPEPREDLAVFPRESSALDQVLSELELPENSTTDQKLRNINRFFQSKFSYRTWQDAPAGTNDSPLGRFLLQTRQGHCEYFATATVLLLRKLNVPARYAVGYAVHEVSGSKYIVRQRDAHSWCLVWNEDKKLWQDFDTTPASWVAVENQRASSWQVLSDAWSRLVFELSKIRWGQTQLRTYILWALVPILGLLLYQILFRSRRRRQSLERGASSRSLVWPGLDSEFYELEKALVDRGLTRASSEPLSAWLLRAANSPSLYEVKEPLHDLLQLHYRYRFDPQGLDPSGREALRREARTCLAKMR
jgi:transglutaminase-like putative cysteine protease